MAELDEMYGQIVGHPGMPLRSQDLAPPRGRYLVGRVGTEVVAGGGLRTLDDATAEIKRMFVVPSWRGQGVARLLLAALESEASAIGFQRVRLDTGPKQQHARRLYLDAGYTEIDDYNANPRASFWGEKLLKA